MGPGVHRAQHEQVGVNWCCPAGRCQVLQGAGEGPPRVPSTLCPAAVGNTQEGRWKLLEVQCRGHLRATRHVSTAAVGRQSCTTSPSWGHWPGRSHVGQGGPTHLWLVSRLLWETSQAAHCVLGTSVVRLQGGVSDNAGEMPVDLALRAPEGGGGRQPATALPVACAQT